MIGDLLSGNPLAGPPPCPEDEIPEPPTEPPFTTDEIGDMAVRVRITPPGGDPVTVGSESVCVSEALRVSGALPGRTELVVRVVGPKPNGRTWPHFVRFSTSQLEVWLEQLSSGTTRYYRLDGVPPGGDGISGLFDRIGFGPPSLE